MPSNSESSLSVSGPSRRDRVVRRFGVILAAGGALAAGLGITSAFHGNDAARESMELIK